MNRLIEAGSLMTVCQQLQLLRAVQLTQLAQAAFPAEESFFELL